MPKAKDLTGKRFGRLIVIRPTEIRKNTFIVWECECDCGNTAFVSSVKLTKGKTTSCGCFQKEVMSKTRKVNLEGQRFGKLTAVKPTGVREKGYVVWECKCDCGNTKFTTVKHLRYGRMKSCGCLRQRDKSKRI